MNLCLPQGCQRRSYWQLSVHYTWYHKLRLSWSVQSLRRARQMWILLLNKALTEFNTLCLYVNIRVHSMSHTRRGLHSHRFLLLTLLLSSPSCDCCVNISVHFTGCWKAHRSNAVVIWKLYWISKFEKSYVVVKSITVIARMNLDL